MNQKKLALILLASLLFLTSCTTSSKSEYQRYTSSFSDTFNTLTVVVAFTENEEEFNVYFDQIHNRFQELHKLFDIYNNYDGINNIKTINDNAGIQPVVVDQEIIDLIVFSKEWASRTDGLTNIALGSVLQIWHRYRMDGLYDPENAELPSIEALKNAAQYTDIDKVIVDTENNTVFLADSRMSLDVGAIAKGYVAELVAQEMIAEGMKSGIISAGGNIRTIGKPLDGIRGQWGVGIQDPSQSILSSDGNLDTVFINNASVVSSGDYQRYYYVGDQKLHHLIDPMTLMPATHYRAVTVVTPDSGVADFISTELFFLPYEESRRLADSFDDLEAIWVMPDGEIRITDGMKEILHSYGASGGL